MDIQTLSKIARILARRLPELIMTQSWEHEWLRFTLPRTSESNIVIWVRYLEEDREPIYIEMMVGDDHSEPYFNKHTTLKDFKSAIDHLAASIAARDVEIAASAKAGQDV